MFDVTSHALHHNALFSYMTHLLLDHVEPELREPTEQVQAT
jgi:hypothetical protein